MMRATDTTAQLVQLGKTEPIGAIITIVFALGTSMPDSMIVVQTMTLKRWR